ncbi:hypothetical protein XENORESO_014687 [Xenotaenia resolanae]|uniref:NADH dehydrogenase subunit 6 n=1 Tax=Xenotaenia resolanae TaxID=208358 RepID=A0ABV0WM73_9TELE
MSSPNVSITLLLCFPLLTAVMPSYVCVCVCVCVFVYFLVWSLFLLRLSHPFLVFPDCLVSSLIGSPCCSVFVFIVPRWILVIDVLILSSSLSSFLLMSGDSLFCSGLVLYVHGFPAWISE